LKILEILVASFAALGLLLAYLSLLNLSECGEKNFYRVVFWRRPFEGREYFTNVGWKLKMASFIALGLVMVTLLVDFILSMQW
jgi:hypothetical protein